MRDAPLMLYVHVPFCRSRCRYCAFFSEVAGTDRAGAEQAYLAALRAEIADGAARLRAEAEGPPLPEPSAQPALEADERTALPGAAPADPPDPATRHAGSAAPLVQSIFVGGGTPSLLSGPALSALFGALRQHFALAPDAEITLEGNPESLADADKLRLLRALGVNRLSVGVQSMRDAELATLGRAHTRTDAIRTFRLAREAGFANVGADLIWGLPGQSVPDWLATLDALPALAPDHVSAYGLSVEAGTPLDRDLAAGRVPPLPDEETQACMYEEGAARLTAHGLIQYEISNFARPGRACRHNQGYWRGIDYLGFGPAAVSTLRGERRANPADLDAWTGQTARHERPAPEVLTLRARAEELVMLRLRTAEGLTLAAYRTLTGRDLLDGRAELLRGLTRAGLAECDGRTLRLTRAGMLVSNAVIAAFFDPPPARNLP